MENVTNQEDQEVQEELKDIQFEDDIRVRSIFISSLDELEILFGE